MAKISVVFLFCVFLILPFIAFSQVVPVPSHPPDGATDQPTTITLRWVPVLLATSYDVHVSTSSDFRSLTKSVNVNSTAAQINGLADGTTYYWRVRAIITLVPGLWSATARFTTARPAPQVPETPLLVSPPNGAANQPLNLTLDWNGSSGADSYTIQVSSDISFSSPVVNQSGINGTSRAVSGLSPGTAYYWRVSAQNSAGSSGWSDIWSFTTKINMPSVPALVSPANGVTGQPAVLTFDWNASSGAESYTIQVSDNNSFSSTIVNQSGITGTGQEMTELSPGTTYYWRVSAQNSAGSSGWSDIWSFTTKINPPSTPTLVAPANSATNQPSTLTFDWNNVPSAESYALQVSTSNTFSQLVVNREELTGTSSEVTALSSGTTYFWRVNARNSAGSSGWSEIWSFTTQVGPPSAPTLVSPSDGAAGQPTSLTLSWNSVQEAYEYQLQVASNAGFSSPVLDESSLTATSHEATGLLSGTTYYWRVRAGNAGGNSAWSETWTFTTAVVDSSGAYRLNTTIDFPAYQNLSDYSPADYKIIGLPGASDAPLGNFLPGTAGSDWQAYWDNGEETDYWVAYDGGPIFVFSVGKAFWILKRGMWTIDAIVPVPGTNANGEVEIPLHGGWNLITNPYLTNILWPDVQQLNSTSEPLYRYVDGRYGNSGYLEPYNGYYFFNETGAAVLRIPAEGSPDPPNRGIAQIPADGASGWRVTVKASNGTLTDDLLMFGSAENATAGKDPMDVHKPRPISGFSSYFSRPEWNPNHSSFATDIRPLVTGRERWKFCIEQKEPSVIRLAFEGLDQIPQHLGALLIDEQSGSVTDLRRNQEFIFSSQAGISTMSLLVGDAEDIADEARETAIPGTFALGSNFPNPFNPSTVIPFELPKESEVRITVHDVLGRQTMVLLAGILPEGRHRVSWDGRDDAGRTVSSGTYFYRLTVPGEVSLARVMVLAK